MNSLTFDEFLRSLKQNIDTPHSLLIGAGASVASGVPSASDCIWDWKQEIFLSQNPALVGVYNNTKSDSVRTVIQKWLDNQNIYPAKGSEEEYSFYAEKSFPIADDRRKYFQHLVSGCEPSLGYHLISMLAQIGIIKSVWTTNFDGLMVKCAHKYTPLTPIEISTDVADRVYRGDVDNELLCIELHGDYKYGALKNTAEELDTQNDIFISALMHELTNRDLIVIGYSGRDKSLMAALNEVYKQAGAGKLFWCGYGKNTSQSVQTLLDSACKHGREAYYIAAEGFDSLLYSISRHCMSNNREFLAKIDTIKKQLSDNIQLQKTKFSLSPAKINKLVNTNAFPITFPKQCYQFELCFNEKESMWAYCKYLYNFGIMAVPYKGMIYAWGAKENIRTICSDRLKGTIELCPLTRDSVIKIGAYKELLLKTITFILATKSNMKCSKDRIWDNNDYIHYTSNGKAVTAFKGVKLSLIFDDRYSYITVTPSYALPENIQLSKTEKKEFADWYCAQINKMQPNLNVHNYMSRWIEKIVGKNGYRAAYPINDPSGFSFAISVNTAIIGVNFGENYIAKCLSSIDNKRIVFRGIEYKDPELTFFDPRKKQITCDFHPMRGLKNNAPIDYTLNNEFLRSSISLGIICPANYERVFFDFITQLNSQIQANYNTDYVITFPGFYEAFKAGVSIPAVNSCQWAEISFPNSSTLYKAAINLGKEITHKIDQLSSASTDVILIYIPKEYEPFTEYDDGTLKFDLHDYVKAYAAQKQVSTQFIRARTIESDLLCQIMWALSLAIYVKSGRIPWTVSGIQTDTAFAGIGYSVRASSSGNNIVVGCSHIYSSDGQGMKYKLSKIHDVTFDKKKNPYLSEDEAYRIGINIKELFYRSFSELPKRVVIHKRTPFRKEEIKGLVESLSSAGIKDIELLEITYEDNLKCFAYNYNTTQIDGFPVRRGLCFPLNDNTMYLYTHGIAPSVISSNRKYIQGGKTIPFPLKVVKHYGSSNIAQIATEILGLSKMNWNSFGLYTKLPCTVQSSNEIARIGWLLSQYEGALYDYRFFM
jgi:NAD-dependent SIR2 family protein deacetylase